MVAAVVIRRVVPQGNLVFFLGWIVNEKIHKTKQRVTDISQFSVNKVVSRSKMLVERLHRRIRVEEFSPGGTRLCRYASHSAVIVMAIANDPPIVSAFGSKFATAVNFHILRAPRIRGGVCLGRAL